MARACTPNAAATGSWPSAGSSVIDTTKGAAASLNLRAWTPRCKTETPFIAVPRRPAPAAVTRSPWWPTRTCMQAAVHLVQAGAAWPSRPRAHLVAAAKLTATTGMDALTRMIEARDQPEEPRVRRAFAMTVEPPVCNEPPSRLPWRSTDARTSLALTRSWRARFSRLRDGGHRAPIGHSLGGLTCIRTASVLLPTACGSTWTAASTPASTT